MDQQLFDRFKKCAVDVFAVDAAKITMEASFNDDLGSDSLDLAESELEGVDTVGKAFNLVSAKVS